MVPMTLGWADVGAASGAILGVAAIVGGIVRYGLIPYLRSELVVPAKQTQLELTGGRNEPSLRELIEELQRDSTRHGGEIEDATLELRAMALMFDGHLDWAQAEVDKLRRERQDMVDAIWAELGARRRETARHKKGETNDENSQ